MSDTTANRGYPLPNPANRLEDDVHNLRDFGSAIDADVFALQQAMALRPTAGDVDIKLATKANANDMNARLADKADASALDAKANKATTLAGYGITDAIGPKAKNLPNGTNLNNLPDVTAIYDGALLVNAPYGVTSWAYVSVIAHSGANHCVQTCRALDGQGPTFERRKVSGVWGIWRPLGLMPTRHVLDTGGDFYGEPQGALGLVNVLSYVGQCNKYMPANPLPGDRFTVVVANGRSDNTMFINSADGNWIMGLNENFVIDNPAAAVTFVMAGSAGWRVLLA